MKFIISSVLAGTGSFKLTSTSLKIETTQCGFRYGCEWVSMSVGSEKKTERERRNKENARINKNRKAVNEQHRNIQFSLPGMRIN